MQIDENELRRRLSSTRNLISVVTPPQAVPTTLVDPSQVQDKNHKPAIATRIVAGSLALQGEPIRDIACEFGLKTSQVRAASKSYDPNIRGPIQSSLDRVSELAIDKLLMVYDLLTPDKLIDTNAKDLSIIAANMSRIVEKTRPQVADSKVQLIIYAPEQRTERSYKVVDV